LQESKVSNTILDDYFVFGELGLDGKIKDTKSLFAIILSLAQNFTDEEFKKYKFLVPKESIKKLSKIPQINLYSVETLQDAIEFFTFSPEEKEKYRVQNEQIEKNYIQINNTKYFYEDSYELDFKEVRGQEVAKRGALIAVSGNHNILFSGSPGCGKSMITKRLSFIMPPLSTTEILNNAKLESLENKEPTFKALSGFRSPHHSATKASIFGGGSSSAKIGEVALSDRGILFFDELPHFGKPILEALREPLEDFKLLISRVNSKVEYSTKFLFVGAMNPCPCGNLLSLTKDCRCSDIEVKRYRNRLSDPFLDRIDLNIVMSEVSKEDKATISSKEMFEQVLVAFKNQKKRNQNELNGKLAEKEINKYCKLSSDTQDILDNAISRFDLSFRAVNKVLKVARTIADLDNNEDIQKHHLLEALSYRRR
jgi:magnesium chelatase family protein